STPGCVPRLNVLSAGSVSGDKVKNVETDINQPKWSSGTRLSHLPWSSGHDFRLSLTPISAGDRGSIPRGRVSFSELFTRVFWNGMPRSPPISLSSLLRSVASSVAINIDQLTSRQAGLAQLDAIWVGADNEVLIPKTRQLPCEMSWHRFLPCVQSGYTITGRTPWRGEHRNGNKSTMGRGLSVTSPRWDWLIPNYSYWV
ncbi:hypothetical protein N7493_010388, partial [Penicillium malachiteum]